MQVETARWHCEPERPRGLEIDGQLELGSLDDREVGWLLALENAARVVSWSEGRLF